MWPFIIAAALLYGAAKVSKPQVTSGAPTAVGTIPSAGGTTVIGLPSGEGFPSSVKGIGDAMLGPDHGASTGNLGSGTPVIAQAESGPTLVPVKIDVVAAGAGGAPAATTSGTPTGIPSGGGNIADTGAGGGLSPIRPLPAA